MGVGVIEVNYFAYVDGEFVPRGSDYLVYEVFADPDDIGLFIANMIDVVRPFSPISTYADDIGMASLVYAVSEDSFSGLLYDDIASDIDVKHALSNAGDVVFRVRYIVMIVEGRDSIVVTVDQVIYQCGKVSYSGKEYVVEYVKSKLSINELFGLFALVGKLSEKYPMKIK